MAGAQPTVLAALLTLALLAAAPSARGDTSLVGRVQVMAVDYKDRQAEVEVYLRTTHTAAPAGGLPGQGVPPRSTAFRLEGPLVGQLRTGQRIRVSGSRQKKGTSSSGSPWEPERLQVSSITTLEQPPNPHRQPVVTLPGDGGGSASGGASAAVLMGRRLLQAPRGGALPTIKLPVKATEISILMIPVSFEGCTNAMGTKFEQPWWTQQDLDALLFEDESNPSFSEVNTVAGRFRSCSYGQASLTRANSAVAPMVRLPCTGMTFGGTPFNTRECSNNDYIGFREAALEQLKAQGFDYSLYRHHLVVLPLDNSCPWVGMANLGCGTTCATWVQGDTLMGFNRTDKRSTHPVMHEVGHNLYLQHAATSTLTGAMISEYGDTSCPMGKCCTNRCYNAPHAWQLGWLAPQLLDGANLAPGQSRIVSITAQSRSMYSGLLINATWAPGSAPLYISYRVSGNADKRIDPTYANRVLVHSYPGQASFDSAFTRQLGVLAKGGNLTHEATGVAIQVGATDPRAATATVTVTRLAPRRVRTLGAVERSALTARP